MSKVFEEGRDACCCVVVSLVDLLSQSYDADVDRVVWWIQAEILTNSIRHSSKVEGWDIQHL